MWTAREASKCSNLHHGPILPFNFALQWTVQSSKYVVSFSPFSFFLFSSDIRLRTIQEPPFLHKNERNEHNHGWWWQTWYLSGQSLQLLIATHRNALRPMCENSFQCRSSSMYHDRVTLHALIVLSRVWNCLIGQIAERHKRRRIYRMWNYRG